jgi:uncharacterized spore protein YtfJ
MDTTDTLNKTFDFIQKAIDSLNVNSLFGAPVKEGDHTVIPVADVMHGFGFGSGSGMPEARLEAGKEPGTGGETPVEMGGAGGGGGGKATPRGFIRLGPDGVSYTPTNNDTLISVAGIVMAAWSTFWIAVTVMVVAKSLGRKE